MVDKNQAIADKISQRIPLTIDDIRTISDSPELQPKFIINDLLIENGKAMLYGKAKRGKTNMALFLGLLLAYTGSL